MYRYDLRDIELITGTSLQSRAGYEYRLSGEVDLWQRRAVGHQHVHSKVAVLLPER